MPVSRSQTVAIAVVVVAAILASVLWLTFNQRPDVSIVISIVDMPQTYDGEHVDRLVDLGPDGIPAIGKYLVESEEFPVRSLKAIERIEDDRATPHIVEYLDQFKPFEKADDSYVVAEAIKVLGRINGIEAVDFLRSTMTDARVQPRVRLAAASSLASFDIDDESKALGAQFVMMIYEKRRDYRASHPPAIAEPEVFESLLLVETDRVNTILNSVVDNGHDNHILRLVLPEVLVRSSEADAVRRVESLLSSENAHVEFKLFVIGAVKSARPKSRAVDSTETAELLNEVRAMGLSDKLLEKAIDIHNWAQTVDSTN